LTQANVLIVGHIRQIHYFKGAGTLYYLTKRRKMCFLTDFILLSCTKAMDISAWSKMNSTAFAPALCYALAVSITILHYQAILSKSERKRTFASYLFFHSKILCSQICFSQIHFSYKTNYNLYIHIVMSWCGILSVTKHGERTKGIIQWHVTYSLTATSLQKEKHNKFEA
jgi:hypothetical protein